MLFITSSVDRAAAPATGELTVDGLARGGRQVPALLALRHRRRHRRRARGLCGRCADAVGGAVADGRLTTAPTPHAPGCQPPADRLSAGDRAVTQPTRFRRAGRASLVGRSSGDHRRSIRSPRRSSRCSSPVCSTASRSFRASSTSCTCRTPAWRSACSTTSSIRFKQAVTTALARARARRASPTTRAHVRPEERLARLGLVADSRRRDRQSHRPRRVRATWSTSSTSTGGDWHFWAFNVADASITIGAVLVFVDLLLVEPTCIPSCLKSAAGPSTAYGVLLAVAYLAGLQLARRPRPAARPRRGAQVMDLGHLPDHRGARRRQADARRRRLRLLPAATRGAAVAGPRRRRVLRRPDRRRRRRPSGWCGATACRCGPRPTCSRRASRWATSSAGSAACWRAAATAARRTCPGRSRSRTRSPRQTSGRRSTSRSIPTQLYDAGAELLILVVLLVTERRGRPFPGRTFWLYMLLYGISRFIVEFFRGDDRGMLLGLSTSQFVSLVAVPVALLMLMRLRNRPPAAAAAI